MNGQNNVIKVVVIGDSGVGKSSLRGRYISDRFATGYKATIGTDFISKTLPHHSKPDETVTLQIWDTAGQERFSSLGFAFFRKADAVILVYDVNKRETLHGLRKWWDEFKERVPVPDDEVEDYCCVVVGNKIDLIDDAKDGGANSTDEVVPEIDAQAFMDELIPSSYHPEESGGDQLPVSVDDPEGAQVVHEDRANGAIVPFLPSDSEEPELPASMSKHSPPSESININRPQDVSPHPYARKQKRISKSSLTDRPHMVGTMSSTRSRSSVYHTPTSSIFDEFESAPSSPIPSSYASSQRTTSPQSTMPRHARRMTSASTASSTPTITPSLFQRTRASSSAAPTPPTPLDHEQVVEQTEQLPHHGFGSDSLPPRPPRGPQLFRTSAKTGAGVPPVFEYIAKRVMVRNDYFAALEERTMHIRDGTVDDSTIRLSNQYSSRQSLAKWASKSSCCGS